MHDTLGYEAARHAPLHEDDVTRAFLAGPHRFLDVGHSRLAAWRFGRGPDVVCIHGWPLHAATFRRIIPALAEHFTLHVIDLPAAGRSISPDDVPVDLVSHAAAMRRAIDVLGLSRFALLAHDSGAAIARLVAAGDDRVAAIVMGNTEIPGHHPWQLDAFVALANRSFGGALLASVLRVGFIRRSPLGFGGCFTDPAYVDGEFGALFVEPMLTSKVVMARHMNMLRAFDARVVDGLTETHARITAPVLGIWGPRDRFFPIEKARAMMRTFPGGGTLTTIANASLFAHEDHPVAFGTEALRFLRDTNR